MVGLPERWGPSSVPSPGGTSFRSTSYLLRIELVLLDEEDVRCRLQTLEDIFPGSSHTGRNYLDTASEFDTPKRGRLSGHLLRLQRREGCLASGCTAKNIRGLAWVLLSRQSLLDMLRNLPHKVWCTTLGCRSSS